jgi:hypothetical protein
MASISILLFFWRYKLATVPYVSALRREMRKSHLIERYTVRELLQEMYTLTQIKYSGKYGSILTEMTKKQREILTALNIQP